MAWSSTPGRSIPQATRRAVLRRDHYTCQLSYAGCTLQAEEIDHIVNLASRGIARRHDRPKADELQAVCRACHNVKTQAEAKAGRRWNPRQPERHPGLLW